MEGGNALAQLLCGRVCPSGHLPFTMAKSEEDYPSFLFPSAKTRKITYDYLHGYTLLDSRNVKAAFPFGFGLSYTQFEYSGIKAEDCGDEIEISLTIKNTGGYDGKTVVQVYAGADGERAVKLLKGFKKIFVRQGETVCETVKICKNDLKFYNPEEKIWYLADDYTFYVGQDCENVTAVKA